MTATLNTVQGDTNWSTVTLQFRSAYKNRPVKRTIRIPSREPRSQQGTQSESRSRRVKAHVPELDLSPTLLDELVLLPYERFEDMLVTSGKHDLSEGAIADKHFTRCIFRGLRFSACRLKDLRFTQCTFLECDFGHCDLDSVTFANCDFVGCTLEDCRLQGRTTFSDHIVEESRLFGQVFAGIDMRGIHFKHTALDKVDFSRAKAKDILVAKSCHVDAVRVAKYQGGFFIRFEDGFRTTEGVDIDSSVDTPPEFKRWLTARTMKLSAFKIQWPDLVGTISGVGGFAAVLIMIVHLVSQMLGVHWTPWIPTISVFIGLAIGYVLLVPAYSDSVEYRRNLLRGAKVLGLRKSAYEW